MENLQVKDGRIQNPFLSQYLIPGIKDVPESVQSVIMEVPDPIGPWGARGMAEMPFIPLAPPLWRPFMTPPASGSTKFPSLPPVL